MKKAAPYATERELCEDFSAAMRSQGWTVYAEVEPWDLMLVKEGVQVGVQAKLRANVKVLAQVVDGIAWRERGPNYAAILLPVADRVFSRVAETLGALTLWPSSRFSVSHEIRWPNLATRIEVSPPLHFDEPAWIPPVATDTPAGVPSPTRLSQWKVSALKLLARLEIRGYVTRADFRAVSMNPSRWYQLYLEESPVGSRRWVRRPEVRLASDQHPDAFATILEWERATLAREEPVLRQATLEAEP